MTGNHKVDQNKVNSNALSNGTYFKVTKKQNLLFLFLYFSYFLNPLLSFYFLIGRKWNWCKLDYPKLSWWVTHVADIFFGHPVVLGKLHFCGEVRTEVKIWSTADHAVSNICCNFFWSGLPSGCSYIFMWSTKNIFKKRVISFITWWLSSLQWTQPAEWAVSV